MLQRYTLRTALLLFVLIPFALLMGIGGLYSLKQLEQQIELRMQEDIELIARAIRLPLSHALERGRIGDIEQALASAFHIDRVYGVYVYDENGKQIAASGTRKAQIDERRAAQLAAGGGLQSEFDDTGGEKVISYFLPLTDSGGRISGLLQVTRRGSDFRNYLTEARHDVLIVLGITCLLLTLIVFLGHYGSIGRYLHGIEDHLVRIGAGENDLRVPEQGPTELSALSRGINSMLDRIKRSQRLIEQQRVRELELRIKLQQTERLAAIGRLASGVAHELGTPLSTIDGKAQRILRRNDLETPLRQALDQIRIEVQRMERIIHQLMDFGRRNPLQRHRVKAAMLAHSVRDQCQRDIDNADIKVELQGEHPGPELAVDPIRIEQALTNLLRNAIQAAHSRVRLQWQQDGDTTMFTVEDDGPGIISARQSELFEPFYTTKATGQGTGLGLAVAHAAVTDHQGRIEVDRSVELGGARFRIILTEDRDGNEIDETTTGEET